MRAVKESQGVKISVLTPTFNRAGLLSRVYESLLKQTELDFEWIVVDDGSSDGTSELVALWRAQSPFPVVYRWQENSGKHVAVNRGVQMANGELLLIVDSDDWLVPHALERVWYWWSSIPAHERSRYAGVAGLCAFPSGEIVGTRFPREVIDSDPVEIRVRYKVKGDKCEVWRTAVLREFPFPENLGRFVTEALVWNRIAQFYKLRYVNETWMVKEYQPEGLSARSIELRAGSPRAAVLYYREFAEADRSDISPVRRIREYANSVRFSLHGGMSLFRQARAARLKALWCIAFPLGILVFLRDRVVLRGRRSG